MCSSDLREFDAGQIQVKVKDGRIIRLDELVKVVRMEEQPQSYYRINGLNSIYLSVVAEEAANQLELSKKEFRRLLDMVYIGNWILNSTREKDRFEDYDILQEKLFALCAKNGMNALISRWQGHIFPSPAYENGGIHEAIADYEDAVFFDILAEELARRDLGCLDSEPADYTELNARMDEYMDEFEKSGVENLVLEA